MTDTSAGSQTIGANPIDLIILNPCPAEWFQLYFSSFEAGIVNCNFQLQKYLYIKTFSKLFCLTIFELVIHFSDILFGLKSAFKNSYILV